MLAGLALLYGFVGIYTGRPLRLDLLADAIVKAKAAVSFRYAMLGGLLAMVGLLFKMGAVPFHMWTPDVCELAHVHHGMDVRVREGGDGGGALRIFVGPVLEDPVPGEHPWWSQP